MSDDEKNRRDQDEPQDTSGRGLDGAPRTSR